MASLSAQADVLTFNFEGELDDPNIDYTELGYPEGASVSGTVTFDTSTPGGVMTGDSNNCNVIVNDALVSFETDIEGYAETIVGGAASTFKVGYAGFEDRNWMQVTIGYQLAHEKEKGVYHPVALNFDFDFERSDSAPGCSLSEYEITEMLVSSKKGFFQAQKYIEGENVKNVMGDVTIDSVSLGGDPETSPVEAELRAIADSIAAMEIMNETEMAAIKARLSEIREKTK